MTNVLLVPIHLDAFYTDGTQQLVAPLANYHNLPYYWAEPVTSPPQMEELRRRHPHHHRQPPAPSQTDVNADNPFLSEMVMRPPAVFSDENNKWTPPPGLHLHWSLPDALTTQRADPTSNGQLRFPNVPNRWLITCSTQSGGRWTVRQTWVVESDYLYPQPGRNNTQIPDAISFPIAPPQALLDLLSLSSDEIPPDYPTQDDIDRHPFYYMAPYRYMGRKQPLSTWQGNTNTAQDEYLPHYRPEGLTAVGYGHPLFASVYSNCSSVFGLHDRLTDDTYPRRYDLIGWYEDPNTDCLQLFQHLEGQNLYDALKSEYQWSVDDTSTAFPTHSIYYARLTLESALQANPPNLSMNISVGNTGTEALSAHLAKNLTPQDGNGGQTQKIVEEQLEAINLHAKLNHLSLDLAAKFGEARHEKGFKAKSGGTLWSVQIRSTALKAGETDNSSTGEVTLPGELAHLLDRVNLAQAAYDRAWAEIESLRHRVFADWYRFELHYNRTQSTIVSCDTPSEPGYISYQQLLDDWHDDRLPVNGVLPEADEVMNYGEYSSLQRLQSLLAATGKLNFNQDSQGKFTISVTDAGNNPQVPRTYTLARQLAGLLDDLMARLQTYNTTQAMLQGKREYVPIRKVAPRYWQPADPVVLFEGESAVSTPRYGEDGRANDDNTLSCTVLNAGNLLASTTLTQVLRQKGKGMRGIFELIKLRINDLSYSSGIGFQTQTQQPWHPIMLEWKAQIWPEDGSTTANAYNAGIDYGTDYIKNNYELNINAPDLRLKVQPSHLTNPNESENNYFGRTILTPNSTRLMASNIAVYLLGLSLYDLKHGASNGQTLTDELDYELDDRLIHWAHQYFTLTQGPTLQNPSSLNPQQINEQQTSVATWMKTQFPFRVKTGSQYELVDLVALNQNHPHWYDGKPVINSNTLSTFGSYPSEQKLQDPLHTAIQAYSQLNGLKVLSQALGGFNDALLTRERTLQLPIWDYRTLKAVSSVDPTSSDWKNYARDVALAVADGSRSAPLFDLDFLPIRSGVMEIPELYLIDSFGQYFQVSPQTVTKSETMTLPTNLGSEDPNDIYLPPRLAQAARLNFRWLAADRGTTGGEGDEPQMNDHPATSPVCGWFIPNNLSQSLMVYDQAGNLLGSLVKAETDAAEKIITWEPAPGVVNRLQMADIPNVHLGNLVSYLAQLGSTDGQWTFWDAWIESIDKALETIEPQSFAQHEALALLMGRPMAVVRASLDLEVQGLPALNQSWWSFFHDMCGHRYGGRTTNQFDRVQFPVRLGEYQQLNDGLVGYWVEEGNTYKDDIFRSSEINASDDPTHIVNHSSTDAVTIPLSVAGDPLKLMMLVDPRGVVHATSGILPTKQIDIPPDQYAKALQRMAVTFLTAPILTDAQEIHLPLPKESGYEWSSLTRPDGFQWQETQEIAPASRQGKFAQQKLVDGWLKLSPQERQRQPE